MTIHDDELIRFEAEGPPPLPLTEMQGHAEHDGARIWYASYGSGPPVILLHGGLGHSGNWGYQVPTLVSNGYRVVVIDSRGHGRSTRDERPYSYDLMAADVIAVMDELHIPQAHFVGWSDGACTSLVLARHNPSRVSGVFYFACNMDPSGTKEFSPTPLVDRCFSRHAKDYAALSSTPDQFKDFVSAVGLMQRTQPNYSAQDLGEIHIPVVVAQAEHDEFIKAEHAEYLAHTLPNAELLIFPEVSHFAPLQRPEVFSQAILAFLSTDMRAG